MIYITNHFNYIFTDFVQESVRTFLKEQKNFDEETIFKIFPFHISQQEYLKTILRDNEISEELIAKHKTRSNKKAKNKDENQDKQIISNSKPTQKNINKDNKIEKVDYLEEVEKVQEIKDSLNLSAHGGSNNCIISGKFTKSGKPILCNDPHMLNQIPAFWYLSYMEISSENFSILGVSHPGNQCQFLGQNGYLAWVVTNGLTDISNIIRFHKVNEETYLLDGKEHKLSKRIEKYCSPVNKNGCNDQVFYYIEDLGIVLNGYTENIYKFLDQGEDAHEMFEEDKYIYLFRNALVNPKATNGKSLANIQFHKTFESFRNNLSLLEIPLNIFVYDDQGDIYYQHTGKIPVHYDAEGNLISNNASELLKHGNLGYCEIITSSKQIHHDIIPFEDLPYIKNPERGFLVSANNSVIGNNYPYFFPGGHYPDHRARSMEIAIERMIAENKGQITPELVNERVLKNVFDPWAQDMVKYIKTMVENSKSQLKTPKNHMDLLRNEMFKELISFDGENTFESRTAVLFNAL